MFPLGNTWPLGDSITWGTTTGGGCAYRDPMYAQAVPWGCSFVGTITGGYLVGDTCPISGQNLLSDGHSGFKCSQITAGLSGWYGSITAPRVVMLHIGTNDVAAYQAGTETMLQACADFTTLLTNVVALDPTMTFFVAGLLNMRTLGALSIPFNDNVQQQVEAHKRAGRKMYYIDMYSALDPLTDFDAGGVHPSTAGYAKMATRWQYCIRTLQPAP